MCYATPPGFVVVDAGVAVDSVDVEDTVVESLVNDGVSEEREEFVMPFVMFAKVVGRTVELCDMFAEDVGGTVELYNMFAKVVGRTVCVVFVFVVINGTKPAVVMPAVVAWEIAIVVVDVSCSVDVSCIVATDVSVLGIDVNVVQLLWSEDIFCVKNSASSVTTVEVPSRITLICTKVV